jgi:hypothetical protein
MASAGGAVSNRLESAVEVYKWFFGATQDCQASRENFCELVEKTQNAVSLRCETLSVLESTPNPYKAVLDLLQIAGEKLKLDPGLHEMLKRPIRTLFITSIIMDDGSIRSIT